MFSVFGPEGEAGGEEGSAGTAPLRSGRPRKLQDLSSFIVNVSQFFNQQDMSDVVLKVGHTTYYGHRFVLAKSSEVFRTMLYDMRYRLAGHPEVVLAETEQCQSYFEPFLRFLYTAEVQVCPKSVVGILCLADKYCVMSLLRLCTQYMVENTQPPFVHNALDWYPWAKALSMPELLDSCAKTISWNTELLFSLPNWLDMDIDFVEDIISSSQLVVSNEFRLYTAVEKWLLQETRLAQLADNSKKLLPLIRFSQMLVHQLYMVEQSELFCHADSSDLVQDSVNQAYRFRSLCPVQNELNITSFDRPCYRPRNYTDLTVHNMRLQNCLRFGYQEDVRTFVGPVPTTTRDGEWKVTYRKTHNNWTIQLHCLDCPANAVLTGRPGAGAAGGVGGGGPANKVQAVLVISDEDGSVLRVETSEEEVCGRGHHLTVVPSLPVGEGMLLSLLLKTLPLL